MRLFWPFKIGGLYLFFIACTIITITYHYHLLSSPLIIIFIVDQVSCTTLCAISRVAKPK